MLKSPPPLFLFSTKPPIGGYTANQVIDMERFVDVQARKYTYATEEAMQKHIRSEKQRLTPMPAIILYSPPGSWPRLGKVRETEDPAKITLAKAQATFSPMEKKLIAERGGEWSRDRILIQSIAQKTTTSQKLHAKTLKRAREALTDGLKALEAVCAAKKKFLERKRRYKPGCFNVAKHMDKMYAELRCLKKRKLQSKEHLDLYEAYVAACLC
jgi:hypothetical protein